MKCTETFHKALCHKRFRYKITKHRLDTWYQFGVSDLVRVFITDLIKTLIYRSEHTYSNPHIRLCRSFFVQCKYNMKEVCNMHEKKYYIVLDDYEHRVVINGLGKHRFAMRFHLLSGCRYNKPKGYFDGFYYHSAVPNIYLDLDPYTSGSDVWDYSSVRHSCVPYSYLLSIFFVI